MKKNLYKWALEREQGSLRSAAKWDLEQATGASSHLLWINTPLPAAWCCSQALHTPPQRVLVQGIIWFHPEGGQNYERQKVKTQWTPLNPQLSLNISWRVGFLTFFLWWQPSSALICTLQLAWNTQCVATPWQPWVCVQGVRKELLSPQLLLSHPWRLRWLQQNSGDPQGAPLWTHTLGFTNHCKGETPTPATARAPSIPPSCNTKDKWLPNS